MNLHSLALFDLATVHLIQPPLIACRIVSIWFETRRFRPNIVISTHLWEKEFLENEWIGHTLAMERFVPGITGPCPRCVMTTLPQADLPNDPSILRTAVQHNQGHVGIMPAYCGVVPSVEIQGWVILAIYSAQGYCCQPSRCQLLWSIFSFCTYGWPFNTTSSSNFKPPGQNFNTSQFIYLILE